MCRARIFLRLNIALMECFLLFCIKCWQANLYTFREQWLFIKAYTHFLNSEQSVHCSACTVFQLLNVVFVSHRRVSLLCPFSFNISRSMVKKNFADGIFGNVYDREAERTTGFSGIRWLTQKLIILGYSFLDTPQ